MWELRLAIDKGMGMVSISPSSGTHVLVIEDDADVLAIAALFLSEEGYCVDLALNAEHGIFKASTEECDAIVVSQFLQTRDGWFVLREIRRRTKCVPVLMLIVGTPFRNDGDHDGNDDTLGAIEYLTKPFTRTQLVSRLRSLIQAETQVAEMLIELGSISVNRESKTVVLDGRIVPLTTKEYSLLELLAIRRGRIVSRLEIYDLLSDLFDASLANLVEVYICNIRRKLGDGIITTCRGRGYIIDHKSH